MSDHNSDSHLDEPDDTAAVEIGRAFLSAQRAASAIIARAQHEADLLAAEVARSRRSSTMVSAPTSDSDTEALAAQVDEIERSLAESQEKLMRVLEEPDQVIVELRRSLGLYAWVGEEAPDSEGSSPAGMAAASEAVDWDVSSWSVDADAGATWESSGAGELADDAASSTPWRLGESRLGEDPPKGFHGEVRAVDSETEDEPSWIVEVSTEDPAGSTTESDPVEPVPSDASMLSKFSWAPPHPASAIAVDEGDYGELIGTDSEPSDLRSEEVSSPHSTATDTASHAYAHEAGADRTGSAGPVAPSRWRGILMPNIIAAGVVIILLVLALLLVSAL